MIDVEDFRAASARLLGKLPSIASFERHQGHPSPRVEIEAAGKMYVAYAAEEGTLKFWGSEVPAGRTPSGPWREFALDPEGMLLEGERRLRIRRMDFDDSQAEQHVKSWPEFAKAKKVRTGF